jgi:putative peptidoglycan lipid II flippase
VQAVIAAVLLRRRMRGVDGRRIVRGLWRFLASAVVAGVAGLIVLALLGAYTRGFAVDGILPAAVSIAAVGVVMLAVYAGMLRMLRTEEFATAWALVRDRIPGRSFR